MRGTAGKRRTNELTASALGVRWPHNPGAVVDRPYGLGMYLFVCYHSPMLVRLPQGTVPAEPGDCILYDPSFPQFYHGRGAGFVDDWLHVDGPGMHEVVERYGIPLNAIIRPREIEFIAPILEGINRELLRQEPLCHESVRLLVESLFLQLGRELIRQAPAELTPVEAARLEEFRNLRMQVHGRLQEPWTVAKMARLVHLSPSRLAVLYAKLLGISPIEDLIHARLQHARALLTDGAISVKEAAQQTGFRSVCHFSRLFRKRIGCAPRDCHRHSQMGELAISQTHGDRHDSAG